MSNGSVTISKIAAEAGVSKSTVSRVLNAHPSVQPDTRARVQEVIDKYNFQPNVHARGITNHICHCIGLVFPLDVDYVFRNPFYNELQRAVTKMATANGYEILTIFSKTMREAMDAALQNRVDGLLLATPLQNQIPALSELVQRRIPIVCLGRLREPVPCTQVCTNNYQGAVMAMEHLHRLGHTRIAYINGPAHLHSSQERFRAYHDCMVRFGGPVPASMVQEGDNSVESSYQLTNVILDHNPDVTAIFLASDIMAVGALNAAKDRGCSIPEDISIVGFDNIPLAKQFTPSITTIDQHIEQKVAIGFTALLGELKTDIADRRPPVRSYLEVPPTLTVGGSSGPARVL